MKRLTMILAIVGFTTLSIGCSNVDRQDMGLIAGGVAGGAAGSVLTGGNALGTVGGAVGGAFLGNQLAKPDKK